MEDPRALSLAGGGTQPLRAEPGMAACPWLTSSGPGCSRSGDAPSAPVSRSHPAVPCGTGWSEAPQQAAPLLKGEESGAFEE